MAFTLIACNLQLLVRLKKVLGSSAQGIFVSAGGLPEATWTGMGVGCCQHFFTGSAEHLCKTNQPSPCLFVIFCVEGILEIIHACY